MNAPAKLGVYVLGLAVVFVGALGMGRVVGPTEAPAEVMNHPAVALAKELAEGRGGGGGGEGGGEIGRASCRERV
jgi:hypothetical protein